MPPWACRRRHSPPGPSIRTIPTAATKSSALTKSLSAAREDAETAQQLAEAHKQDWQEQPHEKAFQVFKQDNAGPNGEPLYTVHGRNGEEIAKFHDQKQADRWASLHRNAWLKKVQTANEAAQQQPQQPQQPQKPTVKPPPVVNTPEQRAKWQRRYQNMAQRMLGLPFLHGARIHATPEGVTIARPDGHVVRRYARKGELGTSRP